MLPSRGRPGALLLFDQTRELGAEDILRLATEPAPKVGPPIIQKLKARHHAIARYLASGRTVVETAALTGLTPQRVGDLERCDPAFQNLLSYYRDQVEAAGIDEAVEYRGVLHDIGRSTLEEIQERVSDPEARAKMSVEELRRLAEMSMDRTSAPPRTAQSTPPTPTKITFNMGPRTLVPQGTPGEIIDGESVVLQIDQTSEKGDDTER